MQVKNTRRIVLVICAIIIIPILLNAGINFVKEKKQEYDYAKAVELYDKGEYGEAEGIFLSMHDEDYVTYYKDALDYCLLCYSHKAFNEENYIVAFGSASDATLEYATQEQKEQLNQYLQTVQALAEKQKEQERFERKQYLEKIGKSVPFVGLSESDISFTALGKPSIFVRDEAIKKGEKYYISKLYDFIDHGTTIFTARCVDGVVIEVIDKRNNAQGSNGLTANRPSGNSGDKSDPYDVNDYAHAEDFYHEHYNDFFDYEEAEEYYSTHHK